MPESAGPHVEGVDVEGMRGFLAETEVTFALLFGSRAREAASESSDVDVALRFPEELSDVERFRRRNRIDAELQSYADGFVDVSDVDALPEAVRHAAVRDGVLLAGDQEALDAYRRQVEASYEATSDERERERREFVDRLASGDV